MTETRTTVQIDLQVIFDSGGGITVQTADYVHSYASPQQAASDARLILNGDNCEDWDGNEPDYRIDTTSDEYQDAEHNGAYRTWDAAELLSPDLSHESSGLAEREFFAAFDRLP